MSRTEGKEVGPVRTGSMSRERSAIGWVGSFAGVGLQCSWGWEVALGWAGTHPLLLLLQLCAPLQQPSWQSLTGMQQFSECPSAASQSDVGGWP